VPTQRHPRRAPARRRHGRRLTPHRRGRESSWPTRVVGADATFSGIATHVFAKQDDDDLKLDLHTFN